MNRTFVGIIVTESVPIKIYAKLSFIELNRKIEVFIWYIYPGDVAKTPSVNIRKAAYICANNIQTFPTDQEVG